MICVLEESKPALQFWMSPQKSSNILNYLDSADLWLFPDRVLRVRVTLATLEASPLFFNLLCLDRRWFVIEHIRRQKSAGTQTILNPKCCWKVSVHKFFRRSWNCATDHSLKMWRQSATSECRRLPPITTEEDRELKEATTCVAAAKQIRRKAAEFGPGCYFLD